MTRHLLAALLATWALPAHAAERPPEQLLPGTTQAYVRWDGVAAHQKAYDASARGQMFAGETGKLVDAVWGKLCRQLKLDRVGEPLLDGAPPDSLQRTLADVKDAVGLPRLLGRTGLVAGFEVRPPAVDIEVLAKLIAGTRDDRQDVLRPQFLLTVIVPGAADAPEALAGVRLLGNDSSGSLKERDVRGRKVTSFDDGRDGVTVAAWAEGGHFLLTVSNIPTDRVVAKIIGAGAGIVSHPLYKKLGAFKEFEVATRGFIDVANIADGFGLLLKAADPAIWQWLDAVGGMSVKSVCFWDGFDGTDSRGVLEIDMPGPRKGLTKVFKPTPLKPADLPPLPTDLTRFAAARLDLKDLYEFFVLTTDLDQRRLSAPDPKKSPEELFRQRHEERLRAADEAVGIKLADLFAALGDKVLTYQAPSDGILNMGQVVAISVNDEKALRQNLDALIRKLEATGREAFVVRKRDCLGVEVREFVIRSRSPVTFSYAICDGWLVFGLQPQPVRGFIYRSKGKLPGWKPDEHTAALLAKAPADRGFIQVADPRHTLQWLYGVAPLVAGVTGGRRSDGEEPFLDPGLIPLAAEANRQLYPNVSWCRDDGTTMRWESHDSLWLPFEVIGLEAIAIYYGTLSAIFF